MERDCAEVFPAALAERDGMAIDFLIAEDEHIRNFLALRVADLRVHAVRTSVDMHPQPGIAQLGGDFISGLDMAIGDRDDFGLDRGEPGGERAGVVLDQDAEEAFERAEERAMDHVRSGRLTVFCDIRDIEAFREIEVELNRRQLPFASDRVADLEVDFRPVKRAAALVDFVVELMAFERFAERLFRGFPALRVADRFLWLR